MDRPKIISLKDPELVLPSVPELPPSAPPAVPPLPDEKFGLVGEPSSVPVSSNEPEKNEPEASLPLPAKNQLPFSSSKVSYAQAEASKPVIQVQTPPLPDVLPLVPEPQKIPAPGSPPWWGREEEVRLEAGDGRTVGTVGGGLGGGGGGGSGCGGVERKKTQSLEREDDLARELSSPRVVSVETPKLVRAYQDQASRDMLPPQVGPQPMVVENERDRARRLAQEIHEKNQSEGIFGRLKRALGMR